VERENGEDGSSTELRAGKDVVVKSDLGDEPKNDRELDGRDVL